MDSRTIGKGLEKIAEKVHAGGDMKSLLALMLFTLASLSSTTAVAGVFNIPKFVEPGKFAIGGEPEATFTRGGGFGLNAKYTHGLTDLLNIQGEVGGGFGF